MSITQEKDFTYKRRPAKEACLGKKRCFMNMGSVGFFRVNTNSTSMDRTGSGILGDEKIEAHPPNCILSTVKFPVNQMVKEAYSAKGLDDGLLL